MAKLHHSETKDIQKVYDRMRKRKGSIFGEFKRPNGKPMTGPDITFLACFMGKGGSA